MKKVTFNELVFGFLVSIIFMAFSFCLRPSLKILAKFSTISTLESKQQKRLYSSEKAHLHYGDNRSKLVHFEEQNFFFF